LHEQFGWKSRLAAAAGGPYVLWKTRQEEKRLARGWTYEPPTFYETNQPVEPKAGAGPQPEPCRYVTPRAQPEPRAREAAEEAVPVAAAE
jgi:hypothetical protein